MNRRMIALLLAAVLVLALTGCAKKEHSEGKPKADLLATTQPVYQLTCALTDGTGLSVGLLISESVSCLHDYTLTVSQMEMIEQSGLVLESGLGLENFMEDVLRGKTRIDISRNLDTLPGEDGADPHWWLDPMRYKQAAELAAQELGAGRRQKTDQIDPRVGFIMRCRVGDNLSAGAPICTVYAANEDTFAGAQQMILRAVEIGDAPTPPSRLIYAMVTPQGVTEY